jgi:hypothetical protein
LQGNGQPVQEDCVKSRSLLHSLGFFSGKFYDTPVSRR